MVAKENKGGPTKDVGTTNIGGQSNHSCLGKQRWPNKQAKVVHQIKVSNAKLAGKTRKNPNKLLGLSENIQN